MRISLRAGLPYFFIFFMLGLGLIFSEFNLLMILTVCAVCGYFLWLNKKAALIGIVIAGAAAGYGSAAIPRQSDIPPGTKALNGQVASMPHFDGDAVSFVFKTDFNKNVMVKSRFQTYNEKKAAQKQLKITGTCSIYGTLSVPDPPGNFHGYSYRKWLFSQRIYYTFETSKPIQCHPPSHAILGQIRRLRERQSKAIATAFPGTAGSMMNALIYGDREGMDPDLLQAYQSLGLIHLLSVSGLHINFIFGMLYFLLIRIGLTKERTALIICLLLPLYMVLAGEAPSIFRSGLMMLIYLGGGLTQRVRLSGWEALSVSGLIILIFNPLTLLQLGFQLSYLVTFSLLVSSHYFKKIPLSKSMEIILMSLIAQIVTLPLLILNFYDVSLLTPFANLIFIPFITLVILPLSFIIYGSSFFLPLISEWLFRFYQILLDFSDALLKFLAHWSFAVLRFGSEPALFLILLVLWSLLAMPLWERLKPVKACAFLAGLFMLPYLIVECSNVLDPYGHVTIFNVGQGDSSFIELPHHKMTMLIDTGGTLPVNEANWKKKRVPYDVGVKVVYHELQAMGVKKLNYLVLTHRDYDHIGGAEGLLRHISVDYILINDHFIIKERERRLFEMAKQKGTKIMIIGHHQTLHIAGYDFRFFSVNQQNPTSNNGSLVLSVRLGGIRWLFTGDLEEEGENALLTQVPDLNTDVLKVGHHGSKTSTTESWLKTLTPKLAIISVGRHNRYGHPSPEVVERIKKDGIPVIRTDKRGEIDFEFKENHLIGLNTAN